MGWHGREYLYRHLVDEFWELKEEHMWLRDRTYAFHHFSDNLTRLEKSAAIHGQVMPTAMMGNFAVGSYCRTCGHRWTEWKQGTKNCQRCQSTVVVNSMFSSVDEYKDCAIRIPRPSKKMLDWADTIVKPNTVGLVARGRKTYGRNLPPEFYEKLIGKLEEMGYNIVWLGEKQSTQPCPVPHVYDFSRDPASRDLERTLAIICKCQFTLQFWTASSRLAGMMGTPYIIFESPEQIYCTGQMMGQEGKRLELTTFGQKKVVLAHYLNVMEDPDTAIGLVERAALELAAGDEEDIIGMVDDPEATADLQQAYYAIL